MSNRSKAHDEGRPGMERRGRLRRPGRYAASAALLMLLLALLPGMLGAQSTSSTLMLRWRVSEGATGYRIQVRDAEEEVIIDERVTSTEFRAELKPGTYEYRLAALDAFEKPSAWSGWFRVLVRVTGTPVLDGTPPDPVFTDERRFPLFLSGRNLFSYSEIRILSPDESIEVAVSAKEPTREGLVLQLDTRGKPEGRYDLVIINPGGRVLRKRGYVLLEDKGIASLPYQNLVPGLPQMMRGQTLRGVLWMTAFAGLAAGGVAEWQAAESLVTAKESSALFQSFNNPVWYMAFARDEFRGTTTGGLLASVTYFNGVAQTQAYQTHQQNQAVIGGVALLLYGGHWLDTLLLAPPGPGAAAWNDVRLDFFFLPGAKTGAAGFGLHVRF